MKKKLSVLNLVMINLAALGGIRSWIPIAACGLSSIFFLGAGSLLFFLPVALVSAELATTFPKEGGVYAWVKEAFGHRMGFLSIWLSWIANIIWYPTILSFIAASISYSIDPALATNPFYNVTLILVIFWGATLINLKGITASQRMSTLGAFCGTFIPSLLVIGFGAAWLFSGKPSEISFSWSSLIPNLSSPSELALLSGVMLSLLGIEMSAVYAADVKAPQKDYPKATLISAAGVVLLSTLGVLGIAIVVPKENLLLNAGCLQAFSTFFAAYDLEFLIPWTAIIIAAGALGSVSTWIAGPSRGLLAAAKEGSISAILTKENKHQIPHGLLLIQGGIVSLLSLLFAFMPTINSAYWILMVVTTELSLVMYILLFSSALVLRNRYPDLKRPFQVPGKKAGLWILGMVGIAASLFSLIISFLPPELAEAASPSLYITTMIGMNLLLIALPFWLSRSKTPIQEGVSL